MVQKDLQEIKQQFTEKIRYVIQEEKKFSLIFHFVTIFLAWIMDRENQKIKDLYSQLKSKHSQANHGSMITRIGSPQIDMSVSI